MTEDHDDIQYDIAIVGAGPGGYVGGLYGPLKGAKIALIEKDRRLGGTCLLRGCIPSKAMIKTAELMLELRHPEQFGLALDGGARLDWERTVQRKDKVVDGLVNGVAGLVRASSGRLRRVQTGFVQGYALAIGLGLLGLVTYLWVVLPK